MLRARGGGHAHGAERVGEVGGDEEDEIDLLRAVGGAAAARDEAGAVMAKSLARHGESVAISVDPLGR